MWIAAALVPGERRVAGDHRRLADARDPGDAQPRADAALVHRARARQRGVLLVQGEHAAGRAAGTAAPCAACRRRDHGPPSSVKPSAPWVRSSAISVSSRPCWPRVIAAMKPTGTRASRAAPSRSERRIAPESTTGSVFGMATTQQNPPAAAARVPVSRSSLCSCPGVRRCTCGSTKAGSRWRPSPATTSASAGASSVPGAPSAAMTPSRTSTSWGASWPVRGSRTCAPRTSSVAGGAGARTSGSTVIALMPAGAPAPAVGPPRARPGQHLVEDRHAHDRAGLDLVEDHRLRGVDDLARQLDAAVDGPGVHEDLARPEAPRVDLVDGGVLAQRRHEGLVHALVLQAQRVHDVGLAQVVERVAHVAAERLDVARDERRRPAERHVRAHRLEGQDVRARDARVGDVADDPDLARRRGRPGAGAACRRRAAPASGARACRRRR